MSQSIELEIQLLLRDQNSFESLGKALIEKLESSDFEWSKDNLNSVYNFLLRSGQPQLLVHFILKNLRTKKFTIPWGHWIEAVHQLHDDVDPEILTAFKKGILETQGQFQACRSLKWDALIGEMEAWRKQKIEQAATQGPLVKKELLEKLHTLRTQQLFIAENELLKTLEKMFPHDSEIQKEKQLAKERHAYEVLNRYAGLKNSEMTFDEGPELSAQQSLSKSFLNAAEKDPAMSTDLAVGLWMLEDYETAYQVLALSEENASCLWLRTELQLKTRRYVELLDDLIRIELTFSDDPETFFATALLRAQAFWGLGQKHTAIEILESLLASRPSYRSASVLLETWRSI